MGDDTGQGGEERERQEKRRGVWHLSDTVVNTGQGKPELPNPNPSNGNKRPWWSVQET
jgi:hypothetical protein